MIEGISAKVIQHGIRRRMPVMGAPMHFPAGHHVDAGEFLIEDCGLGTAVRWYRR
jgi:hypothetical protein